MLLTALFSFLFGAIIATGCVFLGVWISTKGKELIDKPSKDHYISGDDSEEFIKEIKEEKVTIHYDNRTDEEEYEKEAKETFL